MVVGRLLSHYWEGNFSGAMLNFGGVPVFFGCEPRASAATCCDAVSVKSKGRQKSSQELSETNNGWHQNLNDASTIYIYMVFAMEYVANMFHRFQPNVGIPWSIWVTQLVFETIWNGAFGTRMSKILLKKMMCTSFLFKWVGFFWCVITWDVLGKSWSSKHLVTRCLDYLRVGQELPPSCLWWNHPWNDGRCHSSKGRRQWDVSRFF